MWKKWTTKVDSINCIHNLQPRPADDGWRNIQKINENSNPASQEMMVTFFLLIFWKL